MKPSHLLFDLDGTLVDSLPGIEQSLLAAVRSIVPWVDLPPLSPYLGPPISSIVRSALPSLSDEERASIVAVFREVYDGNGWKKSVPYAGVPDSLRQLRSNGLRCFVATNKPRLPTQRILEYLGLKACFAEVVSPDSATPPFRAKHEQITYLLTKWGISAEQALFVGDSEEDLIAAERCAVPFVAVSYGYGAVHLSSRGAAYPAIECFGDLVRWLGENFRQSLPGDHPRVNVVSMSEQ